MFLNPYVPNLKSVPLCMAAIILFWFICPNNQIFGTVQYIPNLLQVPTSIFSVLFCFVLKHVDLMGLVFYRILFLFWFLFQTSKSIHILQFLCLSIMMGIRQAPMAPSEEIFLPLCNKFIWFAKIWRIFNKKVVWNQFRQNIVMGWW